MTDTSVVVPEAWLQWGGSIVHRLPLPDPEPWELTHDGYIWRWSERRDACSIYVRGRQAAHGRE